MGLKSFDLALRGRSCKKPGASALNHCYYQDSCITESTLIKKKYFLEKAGIP